MLVDERAPSFQTRPGPSTAPRLIAAHDACGPALTIAEPAPVSWLMEDKNYIYGERTGLHLVRMAIELTCPAGVLPSEEAVLLLYAPEPIHEAEALANATIETVDWLTRDCD